MKLGTVLVVLAVVLGVLGAGVSYSGYAESLQVATVTDTRSYTTTSTKIIPSTRTEFSVVTTENTLSILDEVFDIRGIKDTRYGGYYNYLSSTLDAGKVNVSFRSEGGPVDFWLLNEDQFKAFQARHNVEPGMPFIVEKKRSSSYEFTTDIRASATYYFVFLNQNQGSVSITLHVDGGTQTKVLTKTKEQVQYSTQIGTLVTETVSSSSHPAGLGLLFFSGIGLLVGAGVVLFVGVRKRPPPEPVVGAAQPASSMIPPAPPPAGKFCMSCGAPLPEYVSFCNKCGSKQ